MDIQTPASPRPALMRMGPPFVLAAVACAFTMTTAISAQTAVAPPPVSAGEVAATPLDELNLRKEKTDPVLDAALAAPYAVPGKGGCASINREIADLDKVLGFDIDSTASPSAKQKRDRAVGGTARSVVSSLIPFDGIIRQISGANAAENHRAVHIYAGSVRRAFLKGYARAKGCRIRSVPT